MIALLVALLVWLTPHGVPSEGVASWYDATKNNAWYTRDGTRYYGAVGSFRWGNKPYYLRVCRRDDSSVCVIVKVADYCGRCAADLKKPWSSASRAIDLSPQAFVKLQGLHRGLVGVTIHELLSGPR